MKRIVFLILINLISLNLYALDNIQLNVIKTAYKVASKYKASDGHTFNDTIASITLTESSAGKFLIGDNYIDGKEKPFIMKSLGVCQVKLETAILIISKYSKYFKKYINLIHQNKYVFKKYWKYLMNINYFFYLKNKYEKRLKFNIGNRKRNIKVLKWIKNELKINKNKFKKYKKYYYKDLLLAQILLSDIKFNIKIATFYLIYNYENAIKRKYRNPWFIAISKYNGGYCNVSYYKKVIKNMKIVRKLKKEGKLK